MNNDNQSKTTTTRTIRNTKIYVEIQCEKNSWMAMSTENPLCERVQDRSEDQLEITTLKLSLTRLGRRGIGYTRYFFCWCLKKVEGEPLIKGLRSTRVRKH